MLTKAQTGGAKELKSWHEEFQKIYAKYSHEYLSTFLVGLSCD